MANSSFAAHYISNRYWKVDEDEKLSQLVREHGPRDWDSIAEHLEGRTGRSCRARWVNHLDPGVNKNPFTKEEEERLVAACERYGTRWSTIAKFFHGRTDNALRCRWMILMRRKQRESDERNLEELDNGSSSASSSNVMSNFCTEQRASCAGGDNSSSEFRASSSSNQKEQAHEEPNDSERKEVPFYDFLGVGDK